jgi:anaerobilin synthase
VQVAVVIDLIYGLPGQGIEQWREDLGTLTELTPVDGVDLYRLKALPGSVMEEQIRDGRLPARPDLAQCAALFTEAAAVMPALGWQRLTVAHWRRGAAERNRYNTLVKSGADYIPVGCGAGGRLGRTRFFQISDLQSYRSAVMEKVKPVAAATVLPDSSAIVDRITGQVETLHLYPDQWGLNDSRSFSDLKRVLDQWTQAGLLRAGKNGAYALTTAGQFWNIQMGMRLLRFVYSRQEDKR